MNGTANEVDSAAKDARNDFDAPAKVEPSQMAPPPTRPQKFLVSRRIMRADPSILFYEYDGMRLVVVKELLDRALTGVITRLRLPRLVQTATQPGNYIDLKQGKDIPFVEYTDAQLSQMSKTAYDLEEFIPVYWG